MPNWCNNSVTLKHKDPAMIERAMAALARGELLQEFIPCPQELRDTVANFERNDAMVEKYGYSNWYDWNIAHWGTKWDVGGDDGMFQKLDDNTLEASFDSAWAPPVNAYEKLIELGFYVKAYYDECGMGFCGVWEGDTENGFFDDYCEYSGETSETIRQAVGEELDDFWGLSERMAEWEEMENE